VQRNRKLDDAEARANVTTSARADIDEPSSNLLGEGFQLLATEGANVGWRMDSFENRHAAKGSDLPMGPLLLVTSFA
jgi:hypothetical protein